MGKAGRWLRTFLMGKRKDTGRKTSDSVSSESCPMIAVSLIDATPNKARCRWSFKKSTSTKGAAATHRSSISFDSIHTAKQACNTWQKNRGMSIVLHAHDAATRIQATFRSYMARRALRALKGLVKLQAVARGYLVRKQMNTIVRSMHAMMKIQVRARIHRIQMVEEPLVMVGRTKSYRETSDSDQQHRKEIIVNTGYANGFRKSGDWSSRITQTEDAPDDGEECSCKICSLDRLSVSKKDSELQMLTSPSALYFTDSTSTTYDRPLEEFSLKMAQQNSRRYYAWPENNHPFIQLPAGCPDYIPCGFNFIPNYMNNTESSKAKARSHSEPRQRPKLNTKQGSRRSSSMDGKNDKENQYPWLIKLCRAGKFTTDRDSESYISAATSISNSRKTLIPFEPPMNLN